MERELVVVLSESEVGAYFLDCIGYESLRFLLTLPVVLKQGHTVHRSEMRKETDKIDKYTKASL